MYNALHSATTYFSHKEAIFHRERAQIERERMKNKEEENNDEWNRFNQPFQTIVNYYSLFSEDRACSNVVRRPRQRHACSVNKAAQRRQNRQKEATICWQSNWQPSSSKIVIRVLSDCTKFVIDFRQNARTRWRYVKTEVRYVFECNSCLLDFIENELQCRP